MTAKSNPEEREPSYSCSDIRCQLPEESIPFEDAVDWGSRSMNWVQLNESSTTHAHACERRYGFCPLSTQDISHYVQLII
jgi:hypothetical protein